MMMDWEEDIPLSPPVRTPKQLQQICAESIAFHLLAMSNPFVEMYFCDPISPYTEYSNTRPDFLLEGLLEVKNVYWNETDSWLGHSNSILRTLISTALMDILQFHAPDTPCRERLVFNAFIYQVLYGHSTGSYPTKCCYPVSHLARDLNTFLGRLGPFELLSIHDSCLMFGDFNPYPVLLKNSPSLKHIFISNNLCSGILESLKKYCKNIEVIEMDINAVEPIEEVEILLCRTFFGDLDMHELLEKANAGEDVPRSFPKLRELYFLSFRDYKVISCNLIFLLQHFYPGIRTRWRSTVRKVETAYYCLCSGKHYPPIVREKNNFQLDVVNFQMHISEIKFVPTTQSSTTFFKANYIEIYHNFLDHYGHPDIINDLMKRYECNKLLIRYFSANDNTVTESLYRIGHNLNELYLYGGLYHDEQVRRFLGIISKCANLKVLSLELLIEANHELQELDFQLLKLESLCLGFFYTNYQQRMTPKIWTAKEFQNSSGGVGARTTTRLKTLGDSNEINNSFTSISSEENGLMSSISNDLNQQCSEKKSHQGYSNDPYLCNCFTYEENFSTRDNKLVNASDILEEKLCRAFPARNGRSGTVDYEKIIVQYVDDDYEFLPRPYHQYSLNVDEWNEAVKWAKGKGGFRGPKDLAFLFSEIRGIHIKPSEGTFRYGQFGYGFYGNGSHGLGYYGYGVDGYGFYGHGEHGYGFYGYGASGFGFYGSSIHTYRTGFHGNGKFGYGCYSTNHERGYAYYSDGKLGYDFYPHPKLRSIEDCTLKSCSDEPFHASAHHALKFKVNEFTEQEDMSYGNYLEADMITKLFLSIISKCPNLKTLELPGMRFRDLKWLSFGGYLSKVCTLKISNTFSLEVKRILQAMPSLSLLIIDGLNGMSNFHKYKKVFRKTDLRVEFYDTRLVYPTSSILDVDKIRLKL